MNDDYELADAFRAALSTLPVPRGPERPKFLDASARPAGGIPWLGIVAVAAAVVIVVGLVRAELPSWREPAPSANVAAGQLPTRLIAGGSITGTVSATDPACEKPIGGYERLWPCSVLTIVTPTAGTLRVEVVWDGPATSLGLRMPIDKAEQCCAPVQSIKTTAGGEIRLAVVFLSYQQAVPDASGGRSQRFTLRTSITP